MSATLPNADVAASWLSAALFTTSYRPVPLEEYLLVNGTILDSTGKVPIRNIRPVRLVPGVSAPGSDLLVLAPLCLETDSDGHGVLVFCASRVACENTAKNLARLLDGAVTLDEHRANEVSTTLAEFKGVHGSLCAVLEETIPKGMAYHHAGLSVRMTLTCNFSKQIPNKMVFSCCFYRVRRGPWLNLCSERVL